MVEDFAMSEPLTPNQTIKELQRLPDGRRWLRYVFEPIGPPISDIPHLILVDPCLFAEFTMSALGARPGLWG
jgi:hypothetical protein